MMRHKGETAQSWDLTLLNLKPQINVTSPQNSIIAPYTPHSVAIPPSIESDPMKVEVDIKPFLKAMREFHITEQQPQGV